MHPRFANHPGDFSSTERRGTVSPLAAYQPTVPAVLDSLFTLVPLCLCLSPCSGLLPSSASSACHPVASLSSAPAAQFALAGLMLPGIMLIPSVARGLPEIFAQLKTSPRVKMRS